MRRGSNCSSSPLRLRTDRGEGTDPVSKEARAPSRSSSRGRSRVVWSSAAYRSVPKRWTDVDRRWFTGQPSRARFQSWPAPLRPRAFAPTTWTHASLANSDIASPRATASRRDTCEPPMCALDQFHWRCWAADVSEKSSAPQWQRTRAARRCRLHGRPSARGGATPGASARPTRARSGAAPGVRSDPTECRCRHAIIRASERPADALERPQHRAPAASSLRPRLVVYRTVTSTGGCVALRPARLPHANVRRSFRATCASPDLAILLRAIRSRQGRWTDRRGTFFPAAREPPTRSRAPGDGNGSDLDPAGTHVEYDGARDALGARRPPLGGSARSGSKPSPRRRRCRVHARGAATPRFSWPTVEKQSSPSPRPSRPGSSAPSAAKSFVSGPRQERLSDVTLEVTHASSRTSRLRVEVTVGLCGWWS